MNISTTNLEEYFDLVYNKTNNKLNSQLLSCWEYFGYPNKELFTADIELLLQTIYPELKIVKESKTRISQTEFRNSLLDYYKSKCGITQNNSPEELEAVHIVELKDGGEYDVNNGLLLEANLHKTFDKYLWCINPYTKMIESKDNINSSINKYKNIIIDIDDSIINNLIIRYNKYITINTLQ